ncbi:ribonuclease [Brumimicrobium salinarum]|uniref:Ribonuclease n=1 Tax=Brumimicrobium salinarum TaxID=2058658 RepID=A0A2I0R4Q0_9FLAO|nr:endonuclease [Brumimicrobium salinarum]PKR81555.1 ribonuclease [Brumimicrobium salinarum]
MHFFSSTLFTITLSLFFINLSFSQVPAGYYNNAEGLEGEALKTALHEIIKDHTEFSYSAGGTDVWDILKQTDKDPNNFNNVILLYTGASVNAAQEYNGGSGWNREHVWAKSHGNFGTSKGPGTDVHHLRPCNIQVNSDRGNKWFGNATTPHNHSGPTGNYYDDILHLWQPRAEVKGDVARMIFYMATRYEGTGNNEPDLEVVDYLPTNNSTSDPVHALLSDLMEWHHEDPVDNWEKTRNDVIYYQFQNNRNPFIDEPGYADLIWGDSTITTDPETPEDSTTFIQNETISSTKTVIKIMDITGREVQPQPNMLLIYIYSDGTREKKIQLQ